MGSPKKKGKPGPGSSKRRSARSSKTSKPKKPQRAELARMVLSAIHGLKRQHGMSLRKIAGFIDFAYCPDGTELKIKREVERALARGVRCGLLKRLRNKYYFDGLSSAIC